MRLLISAIDGSADVAASQVLENLSDEVASAQGLGGPFLQAAGLVRVADTRGLSVVGISEATSRISQAARASLMMFTEFRRHPDAFLAADAPGLNLGLLALADRFAVPSVYYLPPQAWAWWPRRASFIARLRCRVCLSLPFEQAWWRSRGVDATFVGHPLLDTPFPPRMSESGICALLPGTRREEIERHLPLMLRATQLLGLQPLLGLPSHLPLPRDLPRTSVRSALARAEVAFAKCGTVALEATLAGIPTVIIYRMSRFSHWVAQQLVRCSSVGLPNLILERRAYPELLQRDASPENMARAMLTVSHMDCRGWSEELHQRLGPGGASQRVAEIVRETASAPATSRRRLRS